MSASRFCELYFGIEFGDSAVELGVAGLQHDRGDCYSGIESHHAGDDPHGDRLGLSGAARLFVSEAVGDPSITDSLVNFQKGNREEEGGVAVADER